MPSLDLVRGCRLRPWGEGVQVRVEDHHHLGHGFVVELLPDPADPTGSWRRETVRRSRTDRAGRRPIGVYGPMLDGIYEARSIRRAREAFITYFAVRAGTIELRDDEDAVLCRLNGKDRDTLDRLRAARITIAAPRAIPELTGTFRQRQWAREIRMKKLAAAEAAGDEALAAELARPTSAAWWIANRDRAVDELRARLKAPEWDGKRAALADQVSGDADTPC